jgi:hypothetical protein
MPKPISSRRTGRRLGCGAALAALLAVLTLAPAAPGSGDSARAAGAPRVFWGMGPQTAVAASEYGRMRRIGVDSVRTILYWPSIQPAAGEGFQWGPFDALVKVTARRGLEVFPVLYGTPRWLAGDARTLPVRSRRQKRAWSRFLKAAVNRYGPQGSFWQANPGLPKRALRRWQVWNEPNYFYFAKPVSPGRYASPLKVSARALRAADRGAQVIFGGLFGRPPQGPPLAYSAESFLRRVYAVRKAKAAFDAVALHPFAPTAGHLPGIIGDVRRVMRARRDGRTGVWITEIGWGSGRGTAYEKGVRGQVRQLKRAFRLLLDRRRAWQIRRVYWFSWEDVVGSCSFCDSTGLVRRSGRAKPAYGAYRRIAKSN